MQLQEGGNEFPLFFEWKEEYSCPDRKIIRLRKSGSFEENNGSSDGENDAAV